jgi:hypothetical protein
MKMAYLAHQQSIDSLLQLGMELHALEPGFPELNLKSDSSSANPSATIPNLWSLTTQLEKQVPAHYQLHLYTPELLQYYRGVKPDLHRPMVWKTYAMPTQVDTTINQRKQSIRIAVLADDYAADADYLLAACKPFKQLGVIPSWLPSSIILLKYLRAKIGCFGCLTSPYLETMPNIPGPINWVMHK